MAKDIFWITNPQQEIRIIIGEVFFIDCPNKNCRKSDASGRITGYNLETKWLDYEGHCIYCCALISGSRKLKTKS